MKRNKFYKKIIIIIFILVILFFSFSYMLIDRYYKNIQAHQQAIVDNYNKNEEVKVQAKLAEEARQKQDAQQRYESYIQKYIDYYGYTPEDAAYPVQDDDLNYCTINEIPEEVTGLSNSDYKFFPTKTIWNRFDDVKNPYYSIEIVIDCTFYEDKSDRFREDMRAKIVQYFLKPIQSDITLEETTELINNSIDLMGENNSPINNCTFWVYEQDDRMYFGFYLHGL